jgi:hypothetical protein
MNLAARCPQDVRPDVRVLCGHLTIVITRPNHTCEMDQSGDLVSRQAETLVTEALTALPPARRIAGDLATVTLFRAC